MVNEEMGNALQRRTSRRFFIKSLAVGAGVFGSGLLTACQQSTPAAPQATAAPAAAKATAVPAAAQATTAPAAAQAATAPAVIKSSGKKIVAKIGVLNNAEHPNAMATQRWADLVKERTNGEIDAQVFLNGQLGNEKDVCEGMILGSIQAQPSMTFAMLGNWVPEGQLFELPFLFRNEQHAYNVYMGPVGQELADKHVSKGFRILGYWLNGIRHPLGRLPINTPADVKDKKMRVMQSPLHIALWQAVGATPTPMAFSEVYLALQTGVIDFMDNVKTTYWDSKFYEVAPHFTELGHIYALAAFTLSERFWKQLSADQQKVLSDAAKEVIPYNNELMLKGDSDSIKKAIEKGTKVTTPDKTPWINAMQPIWDEWAPKVGGKQLIQKIVDTK